MILCSFLIGSSWTVFSMLVIILAFFVPYIFIPTPNSYSLYPALILGCVNALTVYLWLYVLDRDPQEHHRYFTGSVLTVIFIVTYFIGSGIRKFRSWEKMAWYILGDFIAICITFIFIYILEYWLCSSYNPKSKYYQPSYIMPKWPKHKVVVSDDIYFAS